MSNVSLSTSPSPDANPEAAPLAWMLALLRNAMERVMTDDPPPLKQVNALVRLGSLYLKSYNTAELERVNAELVERVAVLEERMTASGVETAAGAEEAAGLARPEPEGSPAPSRTESAKPAKSPSPGKPKPSGRGHGRPGPREKAAGRGSGSRRPNRQQ